MMTQAVHFRASQEVIEKLDERAAEEGRTRANMLEQIVREALGIGRPVLLKRLPADPKVREAAEMARVARGIKEAKHGCPKHYTEPQKECEYCRIVLTV